MLTSRNGGECDEESLSVSEILPDIVSEGARVLALAGEAGVPLRSIGGVAVRLRAGDELPPSLQRAYKDLDFVARKGASHDVIKLLAGAGYEPQERFNALNSRERLLFMDNDNDRQVDVFVGAFRMCHEIPLDGRLDIDPRTIPPAELLLSKLQIIELNEKDVRDAIAVLYIHDVADSDEQISAPRVAKLCAEDWGLWRTITQNLEVCRDRVSDYALDEGGRERVTARLDAVQQRIEAEPKGRAWKMRNRIGDRKRWYDLPEEVH